MEWTHLNTAQKNAVEYTNGPLMILAGAGSGKTRTLVAKISYLLEEKRYQPYELLALTFSNKAAQEMRERVMKETGIDEKLLQVTTFHSFCARLLRSEATYLGLSRNFVIYDDSESREVIKSVLIQKGITLKEVSPYAVANFIDEIKNAGFYPGRESKKEEALVYAKHEYYPFYLEYESELHRSNAVDFGGLITGTLQLFEQFKEVKDRYQRRYRYILVDEYQDTNRAQFDLISHLSSSFNQVCVVGDEDQSIYSWRGADIQNIFDFEKLYPNTHLIKLEQNYRSTQTIISAASIVIANNSLRSDKKLWTDNPSGDEIHIVECEDDEKEGEYIARKIQSLKKGFGAKVDEKAVDYNDIAVFYRNNAQSRVIEECLRRNNIPYRIVGGIKFYDRKEIKDVISYLKLIVNPKDSLALSRIINVPPRGIGATTLRKIEGVALNQQKSLWEAMCSQWAIADLGIGPKIQKAIILFVSIISKLQALDQEKSLPSNIYQTLLQLTGILDFYKSSKDYESLARLENLQELYNAIKQYERGTELPTLTGFLEQVTLDRSAHETDEAQTNQPSLAQQGEICLMTIHGAKGLEFPYVFVAGVEENIFPSYRCFEKEKTGLEEERRLFYVAMTRAMKELHLTFSRSRMLYGQWHFNDPSRFIFEIPKNFYQWETHPLKLEKRKLATDQFHSDYSNLWNQEALSSSTDKSKFRNGQKVKHALYGIGKIVEVDGKGKEEKVVIMFENGEKKRFLTQIAPLFLI